MSYNKSRIQVIGSFLDLVIKALDEMGIFTENAINACSPLAMTGTFDKAYQKYSDMRELKHYELLNIRKNIDKVLSHDPKTFSDNYNVQPVGKEVRTQNTSEYLVFMNSSMELAVLEKADMVYSQYTTPEIVNAIKNSEGGCKVRTFPFTGSFNWKYYFDRFIDVVLKEYDPEHIIFIRSNCSRFYMDGSDIKAYERQSVQFVSMMEEADNYFIEKTHCLVVDDHLNNIPPRYVDCLFPYIQFGRRSVRAIAEDIYDIIADKNAEAYKPQFYGYTGDFAKTLLSRLSKGIIAQNAQQLKHIDDNMLTVDKLSKTQPAACEFFSDIIKLRRFIDVKTKYRLAEYAVDVQNKKFAADTELIELYARYFKLDLNDIIAVYLLCNISEDAAEYKKIVSDILNSSDCIPVNSARGFKEKNIAFLKEYPYISVKEFTEDGGDLYLPLENNCWLVLNANSDTPIRKFDFNACKEFDYNKVISDGYICSIESADALTYSYDYYIEKARKGDGNKPTVLKFETEHDFLDSLNYVDYPSLLENERFVFAVSDATADYDGSFKPVVDLGEFFDPDLVTVRVNDGLGDQIGYLVLGRLIEKYSDRKVIYEDTCLHSFNGLEVNRFAKKPMSLISQRLSKRLISISTNRNTFPTQFYSKINSDYVYFVFDDKRYKANTHGTSGFIPSNLRTAVTTKLPFSVYDMMLPVDWAKSQLDFNFRDYIEFPPFERPEHIALSEKILSCDSVVMHVRRGDYVTAGWETDYKYYADTIYKIMQLKVYTNKKFFVFSDDITWCKENPDKLGLDKVGDCEIVYVEKNKYEESFRDIQLMALGKIMVVGKSHFARIAALYNDRWEMFFSSVKQKSDLFAKYVRKNKYELDTNNDVISPPPPPAKQVNKPPAPQNPTNAPKAISPAPQTAINNLLRQINRVESIGGSVFDYFIDKGIDRINLYGNDDMIAFLYEQATLKGLQINKCFSDKELNYNINLLDKHLKVGESDIIAPTQIKTECTNTDDDNLPTVLACRTDKKFKSAYTVEALLNYSSLMERLFRTVFEYKKKHAPKLKIVIIHFPSLRNVQNKNEYETAVLNKTNTVRPLKSSGYDDEFVRDVYWKFPEYYKGEIPMLVDHKSKYVNIINGHRVTVGLPENPAHTMFIFGPSIVFGYLTDDEHTIASCIQKELNRNNVDPVYQVLNCSFAGGENYIAMRRSFLAHKPKNGDIAVFFHWPDISLLKDVYKDEFYYFDPQKEQHIFDRPHNRGEYMFYDNIHLLPVGYDWLGEVVVQRLIETGLLKDDDTAAEDIDINVPEADKSSEALPEALSDYLVDIGKQKPLVGAIVMNCNPFTLGHRYLVEYAARKCDKLYIFAVEEDLSFFPFADRIELIKKGVSDLKNVTVLPSGNFIISRTTFPAYFEKEASTDDAVIDASSDIEIFAKHIAPKLNITVRFAGEEPLDNVTRQYNAQMKSILPQYGIKFDVIPRKEINGGVISASRVRKLLKEKNFGEIEKLVPKTTYDYLKTNFDK